MEVYIPLEIVTKIFTLATRTRGIAVNWIVYSKSTYLWFEKVLYEKVVLEDEEQASHFLRCIGVRYKYEEFARTTISSLYLDKGIAHTTMHDIISLCKGVKNLHLSSQSTAFKWLIPGSKVVKLTNYILTHPTLQVLLFHIKSHRSFSYYLKEGNIIDPRIVIAPMDFCKWDDLGRGHMLLWELAEAKVKLRDPNHRRIRKTTIINRFNDYSNLDRIPEQAEENGVISSINAEAWDPNGDVEYNSDEELEGVVSFGI
ncbi:uncharacterized protein EDB93DRAFT_1103795 [Suillus bovinus]|uniref:uncharacterized protein n=1 Tax=Suillus bovinus TaxID=48563 RepID=UPI001B879F29|nr:uncharacterized protein EDB93DRAFT_1103795 [Suillus bovinus]KAG2148753.1 hypothetical protein EDB93DRAFT_1103795 [Suillus bovinus]